MSATTTRPGGGAVAVEVTPRRPRRRLPARARRLGLPALRGLAAAVFAFPLYWMLVTATGTRGSAYRWPPHLFPGLHFQAFATVIRGTPWARYMLNSVFITGSTILLVLVTAALAGYALAAFRLRGGGALFIVLLGSMLLPEQALIIPQYVVLFHLNMLDSYQSMIIPFATNSSSIFLFRQFFASMPPEWREAARMEGIGPLRFLWRVAIPLAKPVVYTVILVTFIASWNMFQWPLIMTQNPAIAPIELALNQYQNAYEAHWRQLTAVSLLALLPILIVFAIAQRHIVRAVAGSDTGVEG